MSAFWANRGRTGLDALTWINWQKFRTFQNDDGGNSRVDLSESGKRAVVP
jgi:hypothetical protein